MPHDAAGANAAAPARLCSGVDFEVIRGHLAAFAIGHQFEVHLLAFAQVAQPRTFHGADMNECVRPARVRCDEAEAFLGIERLTVPVA